VEGCIFLAGSSQCWRSCICWETEPVQISADEARFFNGPVEVSQEISNSKPTAIAIRNDKVLSLGALQI